MYFLILHCAAAKESSTTDGAQGELSNFIKLLRRSKLQTTVDNT